MVFSSLPRGPEKPIWFAFLRLLDFCCFQFPEQPLGPHSHHLKPCRAKEAEKERDGERDSTASSSEHCYSGSQYLVCFLPSSVCGLDFIPPHTALLPRSETMPASVHSAWHSECVCGMCKGRARERKGPRDIDTGKEEKPEKEERRRRSGE